MPSLLPTISAAGLGTMLFQPLPDVEPFSIRSGASYEDILSTIRVWLRDVLVPYLSVDGVQATFQDNLNTITDTVNAALTTQALQVNTALNTAVQELADGAVPITDPVIVAVLNTVGSATAAWLAAHYGNDFRPETYVQAGDNGDWALAVSRALVAATAAGRPVLLSQMYACATTVNLLSGSSVVGFGSRTGLRGPVNTPIQVLYGNGVSGVVLSNFTVDGNCLTQTVKSGYSRSLRFIGSNRIRVHGVTTTYNPDWAASFEQSSNITVTEYSHEAGRATLTGGRDGIHFLDCTDVLLDGAKVHSGDDCVGITSQTQAISNITIRNVTGVSENAAVVTLGNESTSSFPASAIAIENIGTYNSLDYNGTTTNYIVKLLAQNTAQNTDITVSGVRGISRTHGVYIAGNGQTDSSSQISVSNVRVKSTGGHGVYLNKVTNFLLSNVFGVGDATHDGVNLTTCGLGTIHGGGAKYSGMWGLQLNGCSNVDVWGMSCRDNGGASFASNTGGNLRIVNSTSCNIYGGQYVGGTTTSYYGISQSGNTGINLTAVPPLSGGAN